MSHPCNEKAALARKPCTFLKEKADLIPLHPPTQNETEAIGVLFSTFFFLSK